MSERAPVRILLVDDNLDHQQLAMRALRGEPSWLVEAVRSGAECLERAADGPLDLVLLDYRLPDMSGLDVLRALRERPAPPPVLLMTSQGSEDVARRALALGAAGYVVKSSDLGKRLAYEVRSWLEERAAGGETHEG